MLTDFRRDLEFIDGLETGYIKLLYYDLAPKMSDNYKSYEYNRLCTILEGSKHVTVNDETNFTYNSSQFLLLPPNSCVHMDIGSETKALVFELSDILLKKVSDRVSVDLDFDIDCQTLSENRYLVGEIFDELRFCLNRIANISVKTDKNKEFLMDLYAQEMLYNLVKIKGVQQIINYEHNNPINKAIQYMQNNYKQQISVHQLAYDLNMSEANFSHSFKKLTGITPKEYIMNIKLAKAKDMLKKHNVTEVANELGYLHVSHFIASFKDKYGITPKQYQSVVLSPVIYKF